MPRNYIVRETREVRVWAADPDAAAAIARRSLNGEAPEPGDSVIRDGDARSSASAPTVIDVSIRIDR